MDEQKNDLQEQAPETEGQPTPEPEEAQEVHGSEPHDSLKETTEKIWGSTKNAWNTAAFKASQYKKLVQKKIDLSALHKKVHVAHADLGKMIDDLREAGKKNILNLTEVKEILERIDALKAEAASLEEEVEQIKMEQQHREHQDERTE